MIRNFPEEILDLEAFLIWQRTPTGWTLLHYDGTNWERGMHWKERKKHTLRWILQNPFMDQLDEKGDHKYHVAMVLDGTGFVCVDFDYATYARLLDESDLENKKRLIAGRDHMDGWRATLDTYGEESKTKGNYHYLFKLDREVRKIKDDTKRPIDFIGRGLLILTGFRTTAQAVKAPSADDLEMFDQFWPERGGDVPFGMLNFGGKLIDLNPAPHTTCEDRPYAELKTHLTTLLPWYMTGEGAPPVSELHEMRMNLLVHAAEWAYGMPSARDLVWEALLDCYLPTYHAATSDKNKDRFSNKAKLRYMQAKEVAQALGTAHNNHASVGVKNNIFNMVTASQVKQATERAAAQQKAASGAVIVEPRGKRTPPVFPTLPDLGLFKLIKEGAVSNMIGPAAPLWQDIHTLWLAQHVISHYTWASGTRMCPQALVSALSGTGKSAIDDLLLDFETVQGYGQNKRAGGSIGSGAGIRAALVEGVYTTVTSEECGSDLKRIFSAEAKGHDRDARETMIQAINKRIVKPHLLGQSNQSYSDKVISGFMYASHLATQPHNMVDIVNEEWCASGMAMRVPLFIVEPGFAQTAVYSSRPLPQGLIDVIQAAGMAFTMRQRVNVETMRYAAGHEWQHEVVAAVPRLSRLPAGGAMANRVTEMALRYAVVHHMAARVGCDLGIELTASMTNAPGAPVDLLTKKDLKFGIMIAQYHVDALAYVMSDDNSSSQDGLDRFNRMLRFTAREFNKIVQNHKKGNVGVASAGSSGASGLISVTPSIVARYIGSMRGQRGHPQLGEEVAMRVTKDEMKDVFDHLVAEGVLDLQRRSYVLTPDWDRKFTVILGDFDGTV
jgi:hypothetical protein